MIKRCFNCEAWVEVDPTQKTTDCPVCGANNLFHGGKELSYFFLIPNNHNQAKTLLDHYTVQTQPWGRWLVVTDHPLGQNDLRLAEMAFQMNWHQKGGVCPLCQAHGERHCGHLTFTKLVG